MRTLVMRMFGVMRGLVMSADDESVGDESTGDESVGYQNVGDELNSNIQQSDHVACVLYT